MPREWYETLAQCETGNADVHATRSYVTRFGIYRRTWDKWADTPNQRANRLSFEKQVTVVDRIAWRGHTENGRKQWPVGPWGWGCVKRGPQSLRDAICSAKHKAVQRWKRGCNEKG